MKKKKRGSVSYEVFSGMMDVIRTALAALAIVVMLLMLSNLITWLRRDINITFMDLTNNISGALLVSDEE